MTLSRGADSRAAMIDVVQAFHQKHDFANTEGEDLTYRVALMAEVSSA